MSEMTAKAALPACPVDHVMEEGETEIAGIRFVVKPNAEAYDLEIPEINCVYTI